MKRPNSKVSCFYSIHAVANTNGFSQKRKTTHEPEDHGDVFTSKPTAVFTASGGRSHTLSVALPGSIISKLVAEDPEKPHSVLT